MKMASQAGWSLTYTKSSSGFQFVTARSIDANQYYCEFWLDVESPCIENSTKNDVGFFDLPLSIVQLIRFWFGTITADQYVTALQNI